MNARNKEDTDPVNRMERNELKHQIIQKQQAMKLNQQQVQRKWKIHNNNNSN
jgi:hypothetical protein